MGPGNGQVLFFVFYGNLLTYQLTMRMQEMDIGKYVALASFSYIKFGDKIPVKFTFTVRYPYLPSSVQSGLIPRLPSCLHHILHSRISLVQSSVTPYQQARASFFTNGCGKTLKICVKVKYFWSYIQQKVKAF